MESARGRPPKPLVQVLVERLANAMELREGEQRIEFVLEDGNLRTWFVHHERRKPYELARFDEQLVELLPP